MVIAVQRYLDQRVIPLIGIPETVPAALGRRKIIPGPVELLQRDDVFSHVKLGGRRIDRGNVDRPGGHPEGVQKSIDLLRLLGARPCDEPVVEIAVGDISHVQLDFHTLSQVAINVKVTRVCIVKMEEGVFLERGVINI